MLLSIGSGKTSSSQYSSVKIAPDTKSLCWFLSWKEYFVTKHSWHWTEDMKYFKSSSNIGSFYPLQCVCMCVYICMPLYIYVQSHSNNNISYRLLMSRYVLFYFLLSVHRYWAGQFFFLIYVPIKFPWFIVCKDCIFFTQLILII